MSHGDSNEPILFVWCSTPEPSSPVLRMAVDECSVCRVLLLAASKAEHMQAAHGGGRP